MNNTMKLRYAALFIILLISQFSIAQTFSGGKTEQQIEEEAFAFFDAESYQKALPLYQELINVYPQDPEYNYYLGVCEVELNQNVKEAIQHLKIASTKNVNASVPYYLGRAFHMNYQFNSAIRYYRKFREFYKKKSVGIDRLIEMCQNGLPIVNSYYVLDLKKKKVVDRNEFFRYYDLEGFDDRLSKKTKSIKSRYDGTGDKDVACLANKGQYIYFSSYGKNKKNGRDLYRAKRLRNGGWGEWEPLSALNSTFDEIYPYMSSDGRTLYFCSQGHSSMGGFDIFKSVYNEITDTWTEPQNLGFPINSTSNDLFYATDLNGEYACFASSRENGKNDLTIYKIKISEYPEQKVVLNSNLLADLAVLKPNSSNFGANVVLQNEMEEFIYIQKYKKNNFPYFNFPVSDQLDYHYLTDFKSSEARSVFMESKNDQFNSDSLQLITDDLRMQLKKAEGTPKSILSLKITKVEQSSYGLGQQAERKLKEAQSLESDYLNKHIVGTVNTDIKKEAKTGQLVMTSEVIPASGKSDSFTTDQSYIYHLQVGVFSNRPKKNFFSGLDPVTEEVVGNGKLFKYMVGNYTTFAKAKDAIPEIRQLFPNAFVVAYKNGVKVGLSQAIKITDQNYQPEPIAKKEEDIKQPLKIRNSNKVTFKVQVGAFSAAVPQDVKNKLEAFSKYEIEYTKDYRGYTICTVGDFDSYSKVSKLKMELREAGLKDAFTVAYSGNDKITIQQALEILRQ
ncbi:PD40 domain-containing protein [Ancylomarina longa]|nr:PD40 domain-containing protein [Ancylomarina longa]